MYGEKKEDPRVRKLTTVLGIIIMGTFSTLIFIALMDSIFLNPLRAEDAQQKCLKLGYDQYTTYKGSFRKKAYGVKCGYVDYNRRQIDIDNKADNVNEQESVKTFVIT